jgi:hypothetical protein
LPDADVPKAMKDCLISEDNIWDVIRLWDELSACDDDGISYNIMKAESPEALKSMRYIIKATVRCDRVMDSCKKARTILVYKKGVRDNLKNRRPVTLTNCLDRISACLMTRTFQQMNL